MAEKEKAPVAESRPLSLSSTKLILAQHDYNTWTVTIPYGTKPETVLEKTYWRHHVRSLKPRDVIRCLSEDGGWEMWITVIKPEQASVYVSELFRAKHSSVEHVETDDLKIEWLGPALQFAVVRVSSGERIRDRMYPKSVAEAELHRLKARAA